MTTALEQGEILTEVRMPVLPPGTGWAIREITRRSGDLALAGVALTLRLEAGRCADARIAAFGIDATAVRLSEAEDALRGAVPNTESFARAGAIAAASLADPMSCIHASAEYRRHLVGTLLERALADAAARAH